MKLSEILLASLVLVWLGVTTWTYAATVISVVRDLRDPDQLHDRGSTVMLLILLLMVPLGIVVAALRAFGL